jgi:hypothetical protein
MVPVHRAEAEARGDANGRRYLVSDTTLAILYPLLASNPRGLMLERDEMSGFWTSPRIVDTRLTV